MEADVVVLIEHRIATPLGLELGGKHVGVHGGGLSDLRHHGDVHVLRLGFGLKSKT